VFFVPMHAIAFLAGPFTFTWDALAVAAALYVVTGGLGLSMSYHRQVGAPLHPSLAAFAPTFLYLSQ